MHRNWAVYIGVVLAVMIPVAAVKFAVLDHIAWDNARTGATVAGVVMGGAALLALFLADALSKRKAK